MEVGATLCVTGAVGSGVACRGALYGTGTVRFLSWPTSDDGFTGHASPGSSALVVDELTASGVVVWGNGT